MKKIMWVIISLLLVIVIAVIGYFMIPQKIPVLTYHNFTKDGNSDNMTISVKDFEKQIKFLSDHNYKSLTMKDIECFMDGSCSLPRKSVLITIDDGWRSTLGVAAPILKKYNMNATLFYIGHNVNDDNPSFLSKNDIGIMRKKYPNIEIASHTYDLHKEDAYLLSKDELVIDMEKMKKVISNPYFAYPYGNHSEAYHEALKEEEYKLAFTFGPNDEHRKLDRNDNIYELPRLNTSGAMPFWKFLLRLIWIK